MLFSFQPRNGQFSVLGHRPQLQYDGQKVGVISVKETLNENTNFKTDIKMHIWTQCLQAKTAFSVIKTNKL